MVGESALPSSGTLGDLLQQTNITSLRISHILLTQIQSELSDYAVYCWRESVSESWSLVLDGNYKDRKYSYTGTIAALLHVFLDDSLLLVNGCFEVRYFRVALC